MNMQVQPIVILMAGTLGAAALLTAAGCEDASAKQRETVQAQIKQANLKFQKALTAGADDSRAQALNGVVSELGAIEGGEPGQQAAKSVLAATALLEIANLKLSAIDEIESAHRNGRSIIRGQVDAVLRLTDAANAVESIDAAAERQQLRAALDSARAQVIELRQKIEELDAPIGERAALNASRKQEVDALRMKVNDLRRRAQELGHAEGFGTYRQAVEAGRQADKIEYDISQVEIELDYDLTPELTLTDTYAQHLDAMIKAIEEADAKLATFAEANSTQSAATRKHIADLNAQIAAPLGTIAEGMNNELAALYDEARAALERAATQAQSAASRLKGDDTQSARLTLAQAQETLGRLHWTRARALADHQSLQQQLTSIADGRTATAPDGEKLAADLEASIDAAKSAYTSAHETLSQVQSRGSQAQIQAFVTHLDNALAALAGRTIAPDSTFPSRAPQPSESVQTPLDGFATAEELFAYLANLPKDADGMRASLRFIHATTPDGQRFLKATTTMTNAMAEIDQAMREKFSQGLYDAAGPFATGMMPDLSAATLSEQSEDRVVYTISVMGQSNNTVLRKIDGRWMIDGDDIEDDKRQMLPMMEQMAAGLANSAKDIVQRIRSGQLKSAQEAMAAFGQAMMGGMGGIGSPPGGLGTPPPGRR